MAWYAWLMVSVQVIAMFRYVVLSVRPSDSVSSNLAVWSILVSVLYIWGIVSLAT